MLYATDGHCHNAEPGTYGHECGKPAEWLGATASGFTSGFCDDCKRNGYEARDVKVWFSRKMNATGNAAETIEYVETHDECGGTTGAPMPGGIA